MSLRERVLEHLRLRLADDPPPLRLIFAEGDCFDFAARPTVIVTLHSAALPRMLLRGNIGRLCDAYVAGELTVEGPIEEVVRTGIALAERIGRFPGVKWLSRFGGSAARGHSRRQAAARPHYARTLIHWVRRLEEHREQAIQLPASNVIASGGFFWPAWPMHSTGAGCRWRRSLPTSP